MTLFYFYTGWRRLIIISSEGDDYAAGADTIITNLNLYTFNGFNIVHHYEKVTIGASQDEIDSIFSTIIHEGRSRLFSTFFLFGAFQILFSHF